MRPIDRNQSNYSPIRSSNGVNQPSAALLLWLQMWLQDKPTIEWGLCTTLQLS